MDKNKRIDYIINMLGCLSDMSLRIVERSIISGHCPNQMLVMEECIMNCNQCWKEAIEGDVINEA